ncbi:avidin/streptavidin family protein [Nitratireductor sp. ZSWI3]|uniref:avidin/streptavidin family protein n=1 Tax=Nitratireductor sp. ZSWI3 TaxID=2966359 RepID=UPI00214FD3F1|nr:avidin/streptavidin family protein [Nitratireductor sp. ZSWI3]MCR4266301.1 avidin/streptavidin family protein [Nitratireductor sp. ZSWI3]
MVRIPVVIGFALVLTVPASALEPFDPASFDGFSSLVATSTSWVNEYGSTMTISVSTTGEVSGHYVNHAQGTGCQNSPYPVSGRVNGNFIAFSVAWSNGSENCNSATGWSGYAGSTGDGSLEIVTQWNLSYEGGSGPAIESGSDVFTYMAPATGDKPMKK